MDLRDRCIPVPGRKPVVEALENPSVRVAKVHLEHGAGAVGTGRPRSSCSTASTTPRTSG